MYCVKCRKHTETLNTTTFTARNGRPMRKVSVPTVVKRKLSLLRPEVDCLTKL